MRPPVEAVAEVGWEEGAAEEAGGDYVVWKVQGEHGRDVSGGPQFRNFRGPREAPEPGRPSSKSKPGASGRSKREASCSTLLAAVLDSFLSPEGGEPPRDLAAMLPRLLPGVQGCAEACSRSNSELKTHLASLLWCMVHRADEATLRQSQHALKRAAGAMFDPGFLASAEPSLRLLAPLVSLRCPSATGQHTEAAEMLRCELGSEEAGPGQRARLIRLGGVAVVSELLANGSSGLQAAAAGLLLSLAQQDTADHEEAHRFLEACSNLDFFRKCREALRSRASLDVHESVCLVLQKLSCEPSCRKLFEKAKLTELLTELSHDARHQAGSGFLEMNIKSILKHLKKKDVQHASRLGAQSHIMGERLSDIRGVDDSMASGGSLVLLGD